MNRVRVGCRREAVLITLILIGALGIRLLGVHRGLPYIHEWDEPFVLTPVMRMFLFRTLNPGFFVYPSLYYYLLLPVMYLHYAYLHLRGVIPSTDDIILAHPQMLAGYGWYISYPSFYLWARAFTALLGAATVYLTYRIGKATFGAGVGLLAAALLAAAPGAVYYADTVRVDIPMTFFLTAAVLAGLAVLERGWLRDYLLAGLLGGLAISTKQTAVWIVPALAIAHALNRGRRSLIDLRLGAMALCVVAGFIAGTPYILIRPDQVTAGFIQGTHAYGMLTVPAIKSVAALLVHNLAYFVYPTQGGDWYAVPHTGLGLLPGLAAAGGVIAGFAWNPRAQCYLVSFPVLLLMFISSVQVFYVRNLMPVLPFIALLAAVGSAWGWRRLQGAWPIRHGAWRVVLVGIGIAVLLGEPVRDSLALGWWFARHQDTRVEAVRWVLQHAPRGAAVAFELELAWFLPTLDHLPYRVEFTTRDTALSWYAKERIDWAVVSDKNPLSRPPAVVFTRPPYLPSPAEEATFIPHSYPIIDPKILIVKLGAP